MNANQPVHIIRYEDIINDPEPVLKKLLEFTLKVDDISGTKVHAYLRKAVREAAPQIYKPRSGKINQNTDKFDAETLTNMYTKHKVVL